MHYKELFLAAYLFRNLGYNKFYDNARIRIEKIGWQNLHTLSNDEINDILIGFLNRWACRIQKSDTIAEKIKNTCQQTIAFMKALNGEKLEYVSFDDVKKVDSKELKHIEIIRHVYSKFSLIGNRFGDVAASKIVHLIHPGLFVMWDNAICRCYGFNLDAKSYSYGFMPLMKYEVNEAVNTYMKDQNCELNVAIKEMTSKYGETLTKLVDEYNWTKIRMHCVNCRHGQFLPLEPKYYCDAKKILEDPKSVCERWSLKSF